MALVHDNSIGWFYIPRLYFSILPMTSNLILWLSKVFCISWLVMNFRRYLFWHLKDWLLSFEFFLITIVLGGDCEFCIWGIWAVSCGCEMVHFYLFIYSVSLLSLEYVLSQSIEPNYTNISINARHLSDLLLLLIIRFFFWATLVQVWPFIYKSIIFYCFWERYISSIIHLHDCFTLLYL